MKKKKKKAFTLVELIGAIVILAIILLIAVPTYTNIVNKQKEKAYQTQVELIISKAKDWALKNQDKLPTNGGITFLDLSTLVSSGYVDNSAINDPRDGKVMNGCITIIYDNNSNQYNYAYNDLTCADLRETYKPTFVYENKNTEVEVNSIYTFPTKITITNKNGKILESTGPTIKKGNITTDTINTSTIGDVYSVTYDTYDPDLQSTYSDTYTVTVVDKVGPVITINHPANAKTSSNDYSKDHEVYIVQGNTYNLPEASVKDDSCGISGTDTKVNNCTNTLKYTKSGNVDASNQGVYQVKYTATDSSNNQTTLTLSVVITPVEFVCDSGECTYTIIVDGTYKIEGYGAQGGNNGGLGGYISASVALKAGDVIKLKVGTTGGYNGGGASGFNGAIGGGATTITKNQVTILTAGGGGATGSTVGGSGGSGIGTGAAKQYNCGSAAGNGVSGGGGGSTGSCTYQGTESVSCTVQCSKDNCNNNCHSNSGATCDQCYSGFDSPNYGSCDNYWHHASAAGGEGYWCNGCSPSCTTTYYDCPGTCTRNVTKTSYGAGGSGGASSLGTDIIQIDRQDGTRSGNGRATLSYINR